MSDWCEAYLVEVRDSFRQQRKLAERAAAQLNDEELFRAAGEDNSVAVIMKHVGGNLRSRWSEPFTSDGEKPDRNRDGEFIADEETAASVRETWDEGWRVLDETLASLTPADFDRPLHIRGEPHTLLRALHRSLTHTASHAGQVVMLAKHWRGVDWQTLSIARGRSADFVTSPPPSRQRGPAVDASGSLSKES